MIADRGGSKLYLKPGRWPNAALKSKVSIGSRASITDKNSFCFGFESALSRVNPRLDLS
jgi:hypothetical protein